MEEIDLREILLIFWNKKLIILLVTLVFIAIGAEYSYNLKETVYSSTTSLVLASSTTSEDEANSITSADVTLNSNLVYTYSEIIKSNNVLREVIANLEIDEDEDILRENIDVNAVDDTEMIEITVTNANASYAANIANELANVFSEKITEIYNINNVYILDTAEIETEPSNVNHTKDIIIFAFVGFILAIAYVFILSLLDNTIKTAEDIEKNYGLYTLVSIPTIESFEPQKRGNK